MATVARGLQQLGQHGTHLGIAKGVEHRTGGGDCPHLLRPGDLVLRPDPSERLRHPTSPATPVNPREVLGECLKPRVLHGALAVATDNVGHAKFLPIHQAPKNAQCSMQAGTSLISSSV